MPILHLLQPWKTVRLIVDIARVYGLLWMFGLLAIVRVDPDALVRRAKRHPDTSIRANI